MDIDVTKIDYKKIDYRKIVIGGIAALVIAAAALYMTWDRIVIYFVAEKYDVAISYTSVRNQNFRELQFENMRIIDRARGSGLFALHAKLWPAIGLQAEGARSVSFELKGVKFIPSVKKEKASERDYMMDIIALPFDGKWAYKDMAGDLAEHEKGIYVRKFVASGDMMNLSVNGYLFKNNVVDLNLTVYFSPAMLKEVPDSVTGVVLKQETGGWKSLSAHLTGDLSQPSIELSGKLFRLNIKQISP